MSQLIPMRARSVVMAKYGPPVQGNSTAATKMPKKIIVPMEICFIFVLICAAYFAGIIKENPSLQEFYDSTISLAWLFFFLNTLFKNFN